MFGGACAEGFEFFGAGDEVSAAGVEFVFGGVEGGLGLAEAALEVVHIFEVSGKLVVELAGLLGDLEGVFVLLFLLPEVLDDAEGGEQGGGGDDDDVFLEGGIVEGGVAAKGEVEGGFDGDKDEDEVEGVEAAGLLIVFQGDAFDVAGDGEDVLLQGLLGLGVVLGVDVAFKGIEGDLGIDDDVAVTGEVHDDVRADAPVAAIDLGVEGVLDEVFLALGEAGFLQNGLKDHFAPIALAFGLALQGLGEGVGVVRDLPVELFELLQVFGEGKEALILGFMVFLDLIPELGDAGLKGLEEFLKFFAIGLGKGSGVLFQDLVREVFKLGFVLLEEGFGFLLLLLDLDLEVLDFLAGPGEILSGGGEVFFGFPEGALLVLELVIPFLEPCFGLEFGGFEGVGSGEKGVEFGFGNGFAGGLFLEDEAEEVAEGGANEKTDDEVDGIHWED